MIKRNKSRMPKLSAVLLILCFVLYAAAVSLDSSGTILAFTDKVVQAAVMLTDETLDDMFSGILGRKFSVDAPQGAEVLVHCIDVGQGDSFLIQTENAAVLIDAGERENGREVVEYIRRQGIEQLDLVIATHPHSDHMGALAYVIEQMDVERILMPKVPDAIVPTTKTYESFLGAVLDKGLKITPAKAGASYELGSGVLLNILGPVSAFEELNNLSVICRLSIGGSSFLFMGDAEKEAEIALMGAGTYLDSDVLKVGHHGSNTSSTLDFLYEVTPICSVIPVGENNRYQHPSDKVVARLSSFGTVFRTDLHGHIVYTLTADSIKLSTQSGVSAVIK